MKNNLYYQKTGVIILIKLFFYCFAFCIRHLRVTIWARAVGRELRAPTNCPYDISYLTYQHYKHLKKSI